MSPPTLRDVQQHALHLHAQGWCDTRVEQHRLFLIEELAEIAQELQSASVAAAETVDSLLDVIWNACDLANLLNLDLAEAADRRIQRLHPQGAARPAHRHW
jgi:NTP pyrophosphatase (non-canonical NTP hydrolase)